MNRAWQLRLDRGLSRHALSAETGVSYGAIRRLEETNEERHASVMKALGDFFGVPASSLLMPALDPERDAA